MVRTDDATRREAVAAGDTMTDRAAAGETARRDINL
jgi:hypothetical protein